MNHPDTIAIDVEDMRAWANAEKELRKYSWSQFGTLIGVPSGTLQPWCKGNYQGDNDRIAREIFKFRQMLDSQRERTSGVPTDPGYFDTPTSRRLRALMVIAQMGRITVAATGPGTGKTKTVEDYAASVSNVWVSTMRESSRTLNSMVLEVLGSLGVPPKGVWVTLGSRQVMDRVAGRQGLLLIDEANHLELKALEEIRAWHDKTGVGVCLLGNEELLMRIESGRQRDAFARLNSRIAHRHIQNLPLEGDVDAFCDAWRIDDPAMRKMLGKIALTPGAGGLRECKMIVEGAAMIAIDDGRPLSLADLRDAQATRATRHIRT